jgi:hypothetical protein
MVISVENARTQTIIQTNDIKSITDVKIALEKGHVTISIHSDAKLITFDQ